MSEIIIKDRDLKHQWDLNIEKARTQKKVDILEMQAQKNKKKLTAKQKRDIQKKVEAQLGTLKKNKKDK
jgi:hypothetical protein